MSNVIASPGVQFNEIDLTLNVRQPNNSTVYMAGFAAKGPSYTPTYVTSITEYEGMFGSPTNSAERYLYQSARQILVKTNSSLLITRLPYDPPALPTPGNKIVSHSVLAYPLITNETDDVNGIYDITASTTYTLQEPINLVVTRDEYDAIKQNSFDWSYTVDLRNTRGYGNDDEFSNMPIGLIVTNDSDSAINNLFEGMYIGLADNSEANPSLGYSCVTGVKVMDVASNKSWGFVPHADGDINTGTPGAVHNYFGYNTWLAADPQRFTFKLSQNYMSVGIQDTISEIILKTPQSYQFEKNEYQDSLIVGLFSLSRASYDTTDTKLADTLLEAYTGSLNYSKERTDNLGGSPKSVFIENVINQKSPYISVYINPVLSHQDWEDTSTTIVSNIKKVRVSAKAKNLYSLGTYTTINKNQTKSLGYVPGKVDAALRLIAASDEYPLDVTCDAGLSTIWTSIAAKNYDVDAANMEDAIASNLVDTSFNDEEPLGASKKNPTAANAPTVKDLWGKVPTNASFKSIIVGAHNIIAGLYIEFATDTRKDHIHISDPLRHIFVEGRNGKKVDRNKISSLGAFNFSEELYWPLYNLYEKFSTSYAAVYPEWFKVSDYSLKRDIWIPPSGVIAATIQNTSPFEAPAGFTRGVISGVGDTAVSPPQRQRDLLYKIRMNSITTFPSEGIVIYGQKTLLGRPSAFDRLNVRRTFLYLEKATNSTAKYFVFEANTFFTRARVVSVLTPLYEYAKKNSGVYDYKIVCDESNNTAFTIDNNELVIDIYIKPVRTAEFILVNFYATRTDQNFSEFLG